MIQLHHIKSKLLFLSTVPIVLLLVLFFLILSHTMEDKRNFELTKKYIFELQAISRVVHFMQLERGLSIGYATKKDFTQKEHQLENARKELSASIEEALKAYEKNDKNGAILTLLEVIKRERELLDLAKTTPYALKEHYSHKIAMLLTYASTIPTLMDERQNRNFMQAFVYLATAKEALGIIRVTLNQSFINDAFEQREQITIQESLKIYNTELERFKNSVPKEFLNSFEANLQDAKVEKTFAIIQEALAQKHLTLMPDAWFEEATRTIDFFKKMEDALFAHVATLVASELQAIIYQLTLIAMLLLLFCALLITTIITLVKKILSSTNELKEEHSGSLALLEQYKSAVDRSFIVSKTNAHGNITYVNDEFCKISGFSREEVIGKSHKIIRHPTTPKALFKEMWHTIKERKEPWFGEIQNLSKTKESYWTKAVINPILDKNGNVVEYIGIRIDITEIENAKEAALGAQRAKSAFLDTMSHELRTPLNAVIGFSQIIKAKSDLPEQKRNEYIEKIHLSGVHLLGLVNTILDFSKIDSGKMELHIKEFALETFMQKVLLLVEGEAAKKSIALSQEGLEGTLRADEQLFKQVCINILSNAIKFSAAHTTITISYKLQESNHLLTICDEGVGLTQEQLSLLFEPFSQIKEHQNQAIKGTGLGLAISQKIVALHGGTIDVQSTPNKGSCFCISLPTHKE